MPAAPPAWPHLAHAPGCKRQSHLWRRCSEAWSIHPRNNRPLALELLALTFHMETWLGLSLREVRSRPSPSMMRSYAFCSRQDVTQTQPLCLCEAVQCFHAWQRSAGSELKPTPSRRRSLPVLARARAPPKACSKCTVQQALTQGRSFTSWLRYLCMREPRNRMHTSAACTAGRMQNAAR